MSTDKDSTADLPRKIESIHRSPFVPPRWLVYTLLTLLLWGGWGVVSKPVAEKLSPWQLLSLSTIGLLPTALLGFSKNLRTGANVRRALLFAFGSGVIASLGNIAYYAALASGGKAADVTPLTALYPLVTIALAIVFLRERLNVFQAVGVVASLAAFYVFNVGSHSAWFTPWLALALIPIALWGVSALLQKCSVMHGSSELVTVGFLLGALPISLLLPFWVEMKWTLPVSTWAPALAVGLLFGLGNLTLIFAYATGGKASVVTPMSSVYSIVTIPLAVLLLGERLTGRETLGIALALGAAVALSCESQRAGSCESVVVEHGAPKKDRNRLAQT